jgi:hypothetical protein
MVHRNDTTIKYNNLDKKLKSDRARQECRLV